jgi:hypothetical protein
MDDGPKETAIPDAYMNGFHSVFIMMSGVAASALVVSFVQRAQELATNRRVSKQTGI